MVKRGDGSVSWLFYAFFLSDAVQAEEQVSYRNECYGKNAAPHQNAGYTLGFQVYKEVGIDQRVVVVGIRMDESNFRMTAWIIRKRI